MKKFPSTAIRSIALLSMAVATISSNSIAEEGLPKVLVIGDSISIGYTPPLKEILKDKAVVEHNPGNAAHTQRGVENIDDWVGDTEWAVIHFNHGLHDLKFVDDQGKNTRDREKGHIQIPIEDYERNLEKIVGRLEKTGAKLIFATTTPFPEGVGGPLRDLEQVKVYNDAALRVMEKHDVSINDLYSFALSRLEEIQKPNNVHFTEDGSKVLAEEVARYIEEALE